MKKVWNFLRDYWYIPLAILAFILLWILFRGKRPTPIKQTKVELEAIRAGALAREMTERLGAEATKKHIEVVYQKNIAQLNEAQAKQAKGLADDPVALSKFLVRAGAD